MADISYQTMNEVKHDLIERVRTYPLSKQFSARLVKPNTWAIYPFNPSSDTPRPHVLIGDDYALVIDTTDTTLELRKYIETYITDKPLKVASTHSHFDHTGANWQFADCEIFMSALAWEEVKRMRENWEANPKSKDFPASDYTPTIIGVGDTINLGGRELEILPYNPCHSPTSLIYLDKTYGILFSGDEIDPGQINIWGTPVETFRNNMLSLLERRSQFDMICPAHNGTPIHADTLKYFVENCDRVMSGIEGDMDKGSTSYLLNPFEPRSPESVERRRFDPEIRRSEWMGTAINYNINLIFNSQLEGFVDKSKK